MEVLQLVIVVDPPFGTDILSRRRLKLRLRLGSNLRRRRPKVRPVLRKVRPVLRKVRPAVAIQATQTRDGGFRGSWKTFLLISFHVLE
ncbi:hypothetical protein QYF36_018134 [Acer negundo]|nr:hypothetical protein QYF36_018134 [Acer negundo]